MVLVAALLAGLLVFVAVRSGDEGGEEATDSPSSGLSIEPLSDECADLHSGHNAMMWNPAMADEMLDAGCAWPYDPFIPDPTGADEDGRFDDVPFEGRPYDELWDAIGETGLGVCSIGLLPEPQPGEAFGFRYSLAPPGCPDAVATIEMDVREFATRGDRDAAAADDGELVLGRWAIAVTPTDPAADADASALTDVLTGLGAAVAAEG